MLGFQFDFVSGDNPQINFQFSIFNSHTIGYTHTHKHIWVATGLDTKVGLVLIDAGLETWT